MAWQDSIRPASFRGVTFGVTADDHEGGRRSVVHEFPQRDLPYVEDMGAAPARFTLQAFVLGPDYLSGRDALEEALNQPGPGTLVHPWYGELQVCQSAPYKVSHTAADGGMAVFILTFVRAVEPSSPAATVNPALRAGVLADEAGNLACDAFDAAFRLAGQTAHVVEQSIAFVTDALSLAQNIMSGDLSAVASLLGAATGHDFLRLASVGRSIWSALQSLPQPSDRMPGDRTGDGAANRAAGWCAVATRPVEVPQPPHAGQGRQTIVGNGLAVHALLTRLAVVEAGKALSVAVPPSHAAASDLRDALTDAVDAALDVVLNVVLNVTLDVTQDTTPGISVAGGTGAIPLLTSTLSAKLADMRGMALTSLARNALSAPKVTTISTVRVLPSLAICHICSGNIAGEADFVARNGIIHPCFVPAGNLEVLRG